LRGEIVKQYVSSLGGGSCDDSCARTAAAAGHEAADDRRDSALSSNARLSDKKPPWIEILERILIAKACRFLRNSLQGAQRRRRKAEKRGEFPLLV
jgi:hypothetical protein